MFSSNEIPPPFIDVRVYFSIKNQKRALTYFDGSGTVAMEPDCSWSFVSSNLFMSDLHSGILGNRAEHIII